MSDFKAGIHFICSKDANLHAEFLFHAMDSSCNRGLSHREIKRFIEDFIRLYFTVSETIYLAERRRLPVGAVTAELDKRILNAKKKKLEASSIAEREFLN